jgi:hypothetical protein
LLEGSLGQPKRVRRHVVLVHELVDLRVHQLDIQRVDRHQDVGQVGVALTANRVLVLQLGALLEAVQDSRQVDVVKVANVLHGLLISWVHLINQRVEDDIIRAAFALDLERHRQLVVAFHPGGGATLEQLAFATGPHARPSVQLFEPSWQLPGRGHRLGGTATHGGGNKADLFQPLLDWHAVQHATLVRTRFDFDSKVDARR